jgi:hypothetical protein
MNNPVARPTGNYKLNREVLEFIDKAIKDTR